METPLKRIDQEHRELSQTLHELDNATEPKRMADLLDRVNSQLVSHFEEEEGPDGLARAIASSLPQNQTYLDRLFEEHTDFLKRAEELAHRLSEIQTSVAAARQDLHALCEDLRQHEAKETRLITDAVFTDIGPAD